MEGVQASAKNNDSEEIIKNTLSSIDVPSLMTTFEKGKFFVSGSLNSVIITANYSNGSGSPIDTNIGLPVVNSPFSLGIGYALNENYGLELGFRYYGHHFLDNSFDSRISKTSFKSNAWLFGGFLDIPMNSAIGLNIKAGIQNTDTTIININNTSLQLRETKSSSNSWNWYYGFGLSYFIDRDNSVYLDWIRAKSTSLDWWPPVDLNTDSTGFGFKHSF
jgi:hypothetical protein